MLALVLLLGLSSADALPPPPGVGPVRAKIKLTVANSISLEPITVSELLQGGGQIIPFDGSDPGLQFPTIIRDLPGVWQVRIPPPFSVGTLYVNYELVAMNGTPDALSEIGGGAVTLPCTLEEIPPVQLPGSGVVILEGGVRMFIDPNQAELAGSYGGALIVEVSRP